MCNHKWSALEWRGGGGQGLSDIWGGQHIRLSVCVCVHWSGFSFSFVFVFVWGSGSGSVAQPLERSNIVIKIKKIIIIIITHAHSRTHTLTHTDVIELWKRSHVIYAAHQRKPNWKLKTENELLWVAQTAGPPQLKGGGRWCGDGAEGGL